MTFELSSTSFRSPLCRARLVSFLNKLRGFSRFDLGQPVRVFVSRDGSFCAVESVEYSWTFSAFDHKLLELLESPFQPLTLPFGDFYAFATSSQVTSA